MSLQNLQLETMDLLYLHNSSEAQMAVIGEEKYFDKLARCIEFCEAQIGENKIRAYGLASWIAFRAKVEEQDIYLSLQKVHELVLRVAGKDNGFKYVQAPCSLMMPEVFSEKWQLLRTDKLEKCELLKIARKLQINVVSSSPLMQGMLQQVPLPVETFGLSDNGARHVQFTRSIPATCLTSTLLSQPPSSA